MAEDAAPADGLLPDPLVVMALREEGQGLFESHGVPVLYTGIGKVNAAIVLTRRLAAYRYAGRVLPRVLNVGTAGSRRFVTGSLVACHRFVQRDMDVSGLGFEPGVTPFEDTPAELSFERRFPGLAEGVCGSGDAFETGREGHVARPPCDVFDMEGYALAKVCWLEGASFAAVKYVTDGADHAAAGDWRTNLERAAHAFWSVYQTLSL
jgi:adenosylhomocysteine nucleosidase